MKTPHTAVYKGKRVKVILRDGEEFIDKFVDRKSRFVIFENHSKVLRGSIKSFAIIKTQPKDYLKPI